MKLNNPELLRSQCLINGEWCDALSGKREAVINPATGAELASIPLVSEEETQQAIAAAQRAQNDWKQLTAKQRSALLLAWADKVLAAQEDLAQLMTAEQGKSLAEARGEVAYAASFITWFAEEAKRVDGAVLQAPQASQRLVVVKQPIGVCAAITPWNFPAAMITRKVAPALAAGCTIIVKPAEQTPLTALALGVPFITLARWLWLGGWEAWRNADLWPALWQTLSLSAAGALLITLCAIPMAWLSVRYPARLYRVLEGCNYVTSSLPGIVVALALVTITIHSFRPIYQTEITLLLAYLLMFMPRALINLRAGIAQAPVELENVARSLGKSPAQALWSTTLRLAAPGAAAGAALVFLAIANELTATLLLAPNGTRTLATGFWALTSEIDYVAAAPYALIMVALSLPLTWLLYSQSKRTAGL